MGRAKTVTSVPWCGSVLRGVGPERPEVTPHTVVTYRVRHEYLKPKRISFEHGTGQDRETLRGALGDSPRVEDADPPDSVTDEDGADRVPEVEPGGDVEPPRADVSATCLESLCVPT